MHKNLLSHLVGGRETFSRSKVPFSQLRSGRTLMVTYSQCLKYWKISTIFCRNFAYRPTLTWYSSSIINGHKSRYFLGNIVDILVFISIFTDFFGKFPDISMSYSPIPAMVLNIGQVQYPIPSQTQTHQESFKLDWLDQKIPSWLDWNIQVTKRNPFFIFKS